ncbi:MAG: hypothetical protein HYU71_04050 [Bacteroidetes bacterium]|nr:hypothetical protein [Bacteroidota bacterium]
MRIYLILSVFCLLAACSSREGETRAHITQRRTVAAGRLLINYEFRVGGQLFLDSMETANRVVPHDSVPVVYSPRNPRESHLQLP